ncbi:hypothetical protein Tco_0760223 [Tanacetum coccineum]
MHGSLTGRDRHVVGLGNTLIFILQPRANCVPRVRWDRAQGWGQEWEWQGGDDDEGEDDDIDGDVDEGH